MPNGNFDSNFYLPLVEGESTYYRRGSRPTRGISRPVEEFVIARLTIQERMARLTKLELMVVVAWACGFTVGEWAEVRGTLIQNESQAKSRGLNKLGPELKLHRPWKRPGECSECGAPFYYAKGLCNTHYAAMRRRERKAIARANEAAL